MILKKVVARRGFANQAGVPNFFTEGLLLPLSLVWFAGTTSVLEWILLVDFTPRCCFGPFSVFGHSDEVSKSVAKSSFFLGKDKTKYQPLNLQQNPSFCLYRANGRVGFGLQTAAEPPPPPGNPQKTSEKQTVGTVTASHKTPHPPSTFELSQRRHCKERLPGPRKGLWVTSSSLSPKRPRPFTRCRFWTARNASRNPSRSHDSKLSREALPNFGRKEPETIT